VNGIALGTVCSAVLWFLVQLFAYGIRSKHTWKVAFSDRRDELGSWAVYAFTREAGLHCKS
jgi:hypothetical protein